MKTISLPNDVPTLLIRRRSAEERADWTMARIYTEALAEMGAFGNTANDPQAAALKAAADAERRNLRRRRHAPTGLAHNARLSEEDHERMRKMRRAGATLAEIARSVGVTQQRVSVILRGVPKGRPTGGKAGRTS